MFSQKEKDRTWTALIKMMGQHIQIMTNMEKERETNSESFLKRKKREREHEKI